MMFKQIQKEEMPREIYHGGINIGFPPKDFVDYYYVLISKPERLQEHPDEFWDMWIETNRNKTRPNGIFSITGIDQEKYFRITINPSLITQKEAEIWVNNFLNNNTKQ